MAPWPIAVWFLASVDETSACLPTNVFFSPDSTFKPDKAPNAVLYWPVALANDLKPTAVLLTPASFFCKDWAPLAVFCLASVALANEL